MDPQQPQGGMSQRLFSLVNSLKDRAQMALLENPEQQQAISAQESMSETQLEQNVSNNNAPMLPEDSAPAGNQTIDQQNSQNNQQVNASTFAGLLSRASQYVSARGLMGTSADGETSRVLNEGSHCGRIDDVKTLLNVIGLNIGASQISANQTSTSEVLRASSTVPQKLNDGEPANRLMHHNDELPIQKDDLVMSDGVSDASRSTKKRKVSNTRGGASNQQNATKQKQDFFGLKLGQNSAFKLKIPGPNSSSGGSNNNAESIKSQSVIVQSSQGLLKTRRQKKHETKQQLIKPIAKYGVALASERAKGRSRAVSGNLGSEASYNTIGQHADLNLPALSCEGTPQTAIKDEIGTHQRRQSQIVDFGSERNLRLSEDLSGSRINKVVQQDSLSHQQHLQSSKQREQEAMEFSVGPEDDCDENPFDMTFNNEDGDESCESNLEAMRSTVLDRKLICYVSSFQISTSDWFTCFENIEIFRQKLEEACTQNDWASTVSNAIHGNENKPEQVKLDAEDYFSLYFNIFLTSTFQASNHQEAKLTKTYLENQKNLGMPSTEQQMFLQEAVGTVYNRGLTIQNQEAFKIVTQVFWSLAMVEYDKILDKICGDWRMRLTETHRQLKKMDQLSQLTSSDEEKEEECKSNEGDVNENEEIKQSDLEKQPVDQKQESSSYERDLEIGRQYLNMKLKKIDNHIEQSKLPGYKMLKDRVIKPIIVATESLVEYYYQPSVSSANKDEINAITKDDDNRTTQAASSYVSSNSTVQKLQVKFDELKIGSDSTNDKKKRSRVAQSSRSASERSLVGRKRTFKELEKCQLEQFSNSRVKRAGSAPKKTIQLNQRLLEKASATVDLMQSSSGDSINLNQSVSGNFMTLMLELTPDLIAQLEKQEQDILQRKCTPLASGLETDCNNVVLKIIKPSGQFYQKIMQYWFKFIQLDTSEDGKHRSSMLANMSEPEIKAHFINFCKRQLRMVGGWSEPMNQPLINFTSLIVKEYYKLSKQLARERSEPQMLGGGPGSSGSEDEENSFQSILNQFKKVAEVSGLAGLFTKKGSASNEDPQQNNPKLLNRLNQRSRVALSQLSVCRLFDNIRASMERQWEREIIERGSCFESTKQQISEEFVPIPSSNPN